MAETRRVRIGDREVGDDCPCYVIGELGVNHSGSVDTAIEMALAVSKAGASAAKIQKRLPLLHARDGVFRESAAYPVGQVVTELQHRTAMELNVEDVAWLFERCRLLNLHCFASAWDEPSVAALAPLKPVAWKVASPCVPDLALLESIRDAARETDAAVICSTGMSTLGEVKAAVDVLGRERLVLLHCVSTYPAIHAEINLRRMLALRETFEGVPCGYSGHELGYAPTIAAVALGACVVERHITLDRTARGSDHAASLEPHGFALMVRDIRAVEASMGDGSWTVGDREIQQALRLRRRR